MACERTRARERRNDHETRLEPGMAPRDRHARRGLQPSRPRGTHRRAALPPPGPGPRNPDLDVRIVRPEGGAADLSVLRVLLGQRLRIQAFGLWLRPRAGFPR